MSALQDLPASNGAVQTSNFAHVIFQNVAKSYLPSAPLECHYTLTQYIRPHPKDWVGIFKVGWSTARDYYTFLWSPMPENYMSDSTRDCVLTFQGYYLPNDDGEFYQFCYVTHKGEIRGASTPFQFRTSSPIDELLTMEDEGHSDMLVVTTKAGLLELKIEKAMKEKEELQKITAVLERESVQLREQVEIQERELSRERERSDQLASERDAMLQASETLQVENEEVKKACKEMASKILQLEEDLLSVTQKAIEKETELDSHKDKLKKVNLDKEQLELQLKNEKDEKELYKIHLKNTEIENTKLLTEVQTLKNLDVNKENLISHYKEELGKMKICLAEKENICKDLLQNCGEKEDINFLKRQLRKAEDEHQASRQEVSFMSKELSDAVNIRDKTMADLHTSRLETETVKVQLADALAQLHLRDSQRNTTSVSVVKKEQDTESYRVEQDLRKEVEDLKLRLQMAADHYKDKFKECQRYQKQVVKLTEQLKIAEENQRMVDPFVASEVRGAEAANFNLPVSPFTSDSVPEFMIKEQVADINKEIAEKMENYRKCKLMLAEEKAKCNAFADDAAKMELKWKEQLKVNESLKLQLADIKDQYKIQSVEKDREILQLSCHVEVLMNEKCRLEDAMKEFNLERLSERVTSGDTLSSSSSQGFQFFSSYCEDHKAVPIIPVQPPVLQFGNPYTSSAPRDGADGAFNNPDELQGPPARVSLMGFEDNVVCSQPARNLSRPDGLEDPDDNDQEDENVNLPGEQNPPSFTGQEQSRFCFNPRYTVQKKCPLCPMVFPPNYNQSHFEEHVESHWKVCPMCNEQFPPDCHQEAFERHVQTHFDSHVLNFEE